MFGYTAKQTLDYAQSPVSYTHLDVYKRQPQAYPIFHYIAAIETGACAGICPYGKAGDDG